MSVTSDFWKAMNQSGATVSNAGSSGKKTSGGGVSSSGTSTKKKKKSITEEFWEAMGDDDIAPVKSSVASRVQARANGGKKDDEEEQKKGWFQKGLFEDGYDIGDITKTILGTGADILEDLGAGVAEIPEKVADAAAMIAPYFGQSQINQAAYTTMNTDLLKASKEYDLKEEKKKADEFVAKDLYDGKEVAHSILNPVTDGVSTMIGQEYETASVLGDKADSIVQSGGQLLATAGLQAVGVPWFLTTGVTSFGAESENALNQGAEHEEAMGSAAVSAAAEILTEKIGGGIKFGGKAWDDALSQVFARKIANKVGRTAARLGVDFTGEAAEEVLSQFASNIGSSLYRDESMQEILFSEEAFDEYLDSAIGGGLLGGFSGGFKAVDSARKGVDYVTELTANEQKVVDKVYKDRIAEAGKEGKVTEKEKSKIYDKVLSDMDKGYISIDEIEATLGGGTYSLYKNTADSEDAILKEYDELGKKTNATLADQARYNELTQQVKDIRENSQRNTLKTQLSDEVFNLVKGDRLAESYNERSRRGQAFEADLAQYDAKQQAVIQKAIDSGILNNTNRTHEFVDMVAKISADKGVLFDFTNNAKLKDSGFAVEGKQVNGYVTKDGITLNIDSPKAMQATVGHEITHVMEGTEVYDALKQTLFDYAKTKGEYQTRYDSLAELYKDVKDADIDKELAADLVGDYLFNDTDFINNLSTQNRNVFQKIYDEIKYLCKVVTAGSKEARELEKVKKAFEKAYKETGNGLSDTKYSLNELTDAGLTMTYVRVPNQNTQYYGSTYGQNIEPAEGASTVAIAFESNQIKSVANEKPSGDPDIRYSLSDSNGRELSKEQSIFFKDSKVRDENGSLLPVYHGSKNSGFNVFQYSKDVQTGTDYGEAYYFTSDRQKASGYSYDVAKDERVAKYQADREALKNRFLETHSKADADAFLNYRYEGKKLADLIDDESYNTEGGEVKEVYLNLTNPLMADAGGKYYYEVYPEYFTKARKNGNDGIIVKNVIDNPRGEARPIDTYIAFSPEQIKNIDNTKPTDNPDIRYSLSEVRTFAEIEDERMKLNQRERELAVRKQEAVNNPELLQAMDDYSNLFTEMRELLPKRKQGTATQAELDRIEEIKDLRDVYMQRVSDLQESLGLNAISQEETEIREAKEALRVASDAAWAREGAEKENKAIAKSGLSAPEYFRKKALKAFKTTTNFNEAGYMLPDGKLLNFSGGERNHRYRDHREIGEIYEATQGAAALNRFLSDGNIRIMAESPGIDLASGVEPTKEQYAALRKFINTNGVKDGQFFVDFSDAEGHRAGNYSYQGRVIADRVINDIKYFYQNGTIRESSRLTDFLSLSDANEQPVRPNYRATMGEDIALEGIAPVVENSTVEQETQLTEDNSTVPVEDMRELFPDDGDTPQVELDNLRSTNEALENRMLQMGETGDFTDLAEVNDEWMAVQARMAVLEAELQESDAGRIDSLDDSDIPPEMDAPYVGSDTVTVDNPFESRNWYDVTGTKNRSVKSFMAENPDFRPYFKAEAQELIGELMDSQKAEVFYNDQLHYDSGGEKGWMGQKRFTSRSIETLLDDWHMSYDEIQRGLEAIIAGNGAENITPAKKIEFMLNDRLLNGYTSFYTNKRVPPNQDYINFLNERQVNQQAQTQFDSFMETADMYAPEDIAPVAPTKKLKEATPDTMQTPIYESREKGVLKGQTTMFEDKQKTPVGGKTATVLTKEAKVNKKSSKIWSLIKNHVFDKGMVFEDVSKKTGNRELEGKWNFIRYSRARAQGLIGKGAEGVRSLKDIKKEVDKSGKTEAFFDYLYHRHNEDRMSLEDRFGVPNKAVYGDHVTAAISRVTYKQLEKANPEFKRWANDIYAYNQKLRSLLVENDVISKETAKLWERMYPHYVPVGRVDQNGLNVNVPLDSRKTGVNNPVQRATGGNQDIRPLFNVMAERTAQTYRAIARNRFGIELKNTLGSEVGKNAQNVDEVIDSLSDDNVLLKPGVNGESATFTVFENGEKVEFNITDEMYEALKPTSEGLMYRNKVLNTASSVFRGLTTQYSIPFVATNAIKDAQDVLINSQHPARTYANMIFPRAQFQIATRGKWYQEYMENGGEDNTYFDTETGSFDENVFKKGFDFITAPVTMANNFIEMTPRLAEYIASREAGRSIEVSMLDAARVTTNFAAGGDITKFANANGATFLNASVQGAVQQVRNVREAYHKGFMGWVGLAARFAVAGLPAILLNNMLWDDDEEYEELADYVKQDYYVIGKYDDGKFIRIPKGRTVAVIQNAIEQVQKAATGDDEVDLATFLQLAVNNLAPNNPLTNNIVAPIGQVLTNRTWYGEELVDYYMQQLPEMEQYDENTSSVSIDLSKKINELTGAEISPVKIDYLLNQYSGGIGDVLLPMSTPKAEHGDDSTWGNITAPLKDKFTTDSVLNSKRNAEYKEAKNAAHKAAKSVNATDEDILRSQYFYAKSDEMSELYDQKREIQNSNLSDTEKYEKAREIQEKINDIAVEALNNNQNVNIDGYYATIGDKRFDYSDYKGKWYEIEGEYLEKEQNAIKRYGITPSDYWNDTDLYYHADYYFKYSPELEDVSKRVFDGKWFAGYAAEVSQIKGDDFNNDGKTDTGTKKKKVFAYIDGLDVDDIEKKILRKMSYPSEDKYNYEIIDYLNNRDDISYDDMNTILEALTFKVDSEGYITWD